MMSGTVLGTLFIVGGLVLAYVAFATPFLDLALPSGRPDPHPDRLRHRASGPWRSSRPPASSWPAPTVSPATSRPPAAAPRAGRSTLKELDSLPDDFTVASGLTLADGRGVSELVIGPFGAAVIRELPPAAVTRIQGDNWQVAGRAAGSRWRTRSSGRRAMRNASVTG